MTPAAVTRNIRLLYAFWFLREFHLWIPVWIVFLTVERGFSLTEVTAAEGLFLVGIVLLEVPTGAVADHWGRSRSLALGALLLGVSILIYAFTSSFAVLLASFLLWSVAHTLMSGADMALLYDTLKLDGREAAYERIAGRGTALSWAAAGIGTFAGGPVAALLDIRATILVGAATCVVTAVAAWVMVEPPHQREAEASEPKLGYGRSIVTAFREIWHAPDVRAVVLLTGVGLAALESTSYLVQPYLLDRGIEIGVWFSMLQVPTILAGVGGALVAARLAAKYATSSMVLVPAVGVVGFAVLALTPGMAAYPVLPLMYVLTSLLLPLATGYVNRRIASDRRATVLSMHGMVSALVLAAIAPALGYATDAWGLTWAFAIASSACLATVLLFGAPLIARGRPEAGTAAAATADA